MEDKYKKLSEKDKLTYEANFLYAHYKAHDLDLTDMTMNMRAKHGIGYLPQEASVFRKLTVEENIWSVLETRRDLSKDAKKEKLEMKRQS